MQNYVNINSRLYADLFENGGDNLVAVYTMLKSAKNGGIKIYKENRSIYHTLKSKTNLSISTLRKYIKVLMEMDICYFDLSGNFVLAGNNKINKEFRSRRNKCVPVEIGTYKETKLYSFRVRVLTAEQQQKNRIDRRYKQNNIIARESKSYRLSEEELRFKKSWTKSDLKYADNLESFNAKTVMSNHGFSRLKFGETKSKSSGQYWKKKLVRAGIIKTRRKYQYIKKCSYKEYRVLKLTVDKSLMFSEGKLFKELCPEFTTTDFPKAAKKIEKLDYLQFDFCHFLANQ